MKYFNQCMVVVFLLLSFSYGAKADPNDAVALNVWYQQFPQVNQTGIRNLTNPRPVSRVALKQAVYWSVSKGGGGLLLTLQQVEGQATQVSCVIDDPDIGCASAPLFIASRNATVTIVSDLAVSTPPSGAVITVYTCMTSKCIRTQAVDVKESALLAATDDDVSFTVNGSGPSAQRDILVAGGSWVYFDLTGAGLTGGITQTVSVKVVGN
jgi:hypothetical protein